MSERIIVNIYETTPPTLIPCDVYNLQTEFKGMIPYEGGEIDLGSPFRRASMADLVLEATGVDFGSYADDVEGAKAAALEAMEKADVATHAAVSSLARESSLRV